MNIDEIKSEIQENYQSHGGKISEPLLLAVSKLQSVEKIYQLADAGQKSFAENYVQEALLKQSQMVDRQLDWHFIGHLQKNKVKQVIGKFNLIHSVDSFELASLMNKKCEELQIRQKILLQVNVSGEASKQGFDEENVKKYFTEMKNFLSLDIRGLMTMPPLDLDGETARPYFRRLRELGNHLGLSELSMGTSHDFRVALQEGATIIRLGTILFGERPRK